MAEELCPTCHSRIGADSTTDVGRIQGKEGTDDSGNPVPRWSDDPVFTGRGLNPDPYDKKSTRIRKKHIKEIQDTRKEQEAEAGIAVTDFSDIDTDKHISRRHFVELRESTEKLLNANGLTLEEYFKLDDNGEEQPENPKVSASAGKSSQTAQNEWVDVERGESYVSKDASLTSEFTLPDGSTEQSPTLPKRTHIRAIHIEDLRHPIGVGLLAFVIDINSTLFTGRKRGQADFIDVERCP